MKKLVGKVTEDERDEIRGLYGRKNGLNDIIKIVAADNDAIYQKIVADIADTTLKFQQWWNRMYEKYNWENVEGGNWEIDFETCDIYLIEP